jgi:AcrR family transcriptional regulator
MASMPTRREAEDAASPAVGDAADWSSRRADARRNHERVIAAAVEVFTEHGLEATIPQVAARAGVGKATVYRSFPTKGDLVRALAQVHVDWLVARIAEADVAAADDAYAALESALVDIADRLARDRLMVEVLSGVEGLRDPDSEDRTSRILQLGVEQGVLRPDVSGTDVQVLMSGAARALLDLDVRDPEVWRRYARLCVAALRP